jgi:hypothetical protein
VKKPQEEMSSKLAAGEVVRRRGANKVVDFYKVSDQKQDKDEEDSVGTDNSFLNDDEAYKRIKKQKNINKQVIKP